MSSTSSAAAASSVSVPDAMSWHSFIPSDAERFQTEATLSKALSALEAAVQQPILSESFAHEVDRIDPLSPFRHEFVIPKARAIGDAILSGQSPEERGVIPAEVTEELDSVYLCGNSLGLLPRRAQSYVEAELAKWGAVGVEGHFAGDRPWARIDEPPTALSMQVVGAALEGEIAIMNSLSVNLHLLLTSFYRPTAIRHKILMENDAFCSDHHVIRSQVALHGYQTDTSIVLLKPREGEATLRTEDIVSAIETHGDELSVVLLPGVQFYTGQLFDMEAITKAGHKVGAYVGFDLAHAVGNVPLSLHDWQVDFAAWCSYKYLNAGPGSISGIFVHESHFTNEKNFPKLRGWWGQLPGQRFKMSSEHVEKPGAQSYMLSNPAVLPTVCLQASLEVHNRAEQKRMRAKSMCLTGYLELLLKKEIIEKQTSQSVTIRILTPSNPSARGCQLSLLFSVPVRNIHHQLSLFGIVTDVREPNVLRVSPTPLYNTFTDVYTVVKQLKVVLNKLNAKQ